MRRLKQISNICVLIIDNKGYNSHYIHLKESIAQISFFCIYFILSEYKFIRQKDQFEAILLNIDLDTKFFWTFGTNITLLRVNSLSDVIFNAIFPCPSTFVVEEFPMKSFSPLITSNRKWTFPFRSKHVEQPQCHPTMSIFISDTSLEK